MTDPRSSRPARASLFGKRTATVKTSVDEETKEILEAKARALGYATLAEYVADVLTINARGLDTVTSLQVERLKAAATIGPKKGGEDT